MSAKEAQGRLLVGCSGFSYDDWQGAFYPEGLAKEERLAHYALFFPFVELNFSYYQMPSARCLLAMAERTPSSFHFSIKAHRSLTHEPSEVWKEDAELFRTAVLPLAEHDRLACVILQLPYRFHYTIENRVYLGQLMDELEPFPLAVEFRNSDWQNERVREELERRKAALLCVDEPELPRLPRPEAVVTAPFAYVRFHGRNAEAWWTGDNSSRYDYDYSDEELRSWLPRIATLRASALVTYVAFNNHVKGRAVTNARHLKELVDTFQPPSTP